MAIHKKSVFLILFFIASLFTQDGWSGGLSAGSKSISSSGLSNPTPFCPAGSSWSDQGGGGNCILKAPPCNNPEGFIAIRTVEDLANIAADLSGNYFLCNNLDLSGIDWEPIGGCLDSTNCENSFSGIFKGNNKTISNLNIQTSVQDVGLFGYIFQGTVQNLNLSSVNVEFTNDIPDLWSMSIGTLAGRVAYGSLQNISVDNAIISTTTASHINHRAGGIVGYLSVPEVVSELSGNQIVIQSNAGSIGGIIGYLLTFDAEDVLTDLFLENSSIEGDTFVGGLIGHMNVINAQITSSCVGDGVTVRGRSWVGGLAGFNYRAIISNSCSHAEVIGDVGDLDPFGGYSYNIGGFIGKNNGVIINSYATGSVSGSQPGTAFIGGFAGSHELISSWGNAIIANSYSTGMVTGDPMVSGGFVGQLYGNAEVLSSYFNLDANPSLPADDGSGNVGKTEQELKTRDTFFPEWDISYTNDPAETAWKICSPDGTDYPRLWWEEAPSCSLPDDPILDGGIHDHSGFGIGNHGPGG